MYIQGVEGDVQVAKWGNSLAVRLPAELVRELGLREGDEVALRAEDGGFAIRREARPEEVLAGLRKFRGRLAATDRLSRDEANGR
jgi:antitoxin MazE